MDDSAKKYIDQPRYLYDLNLLFAVPKPKPLPPVLNTLRPFPALLWASICFTVAIAGMVIAMIYCCQERIFKKNVNPDASVPIFWLFACLTSQSRTIPIAELGSFKLVLVFWIGFTSFITFSYECNLRANLIHVEYEEPLNTLQDLIDKDRQLYLAGGTSFQKILSESIIPEERHFGEMVTQKGLEFFYERDGLLPRELENQILHNGDAYLTGSRIGTMAFPKIQKVLGFQPYRFGQKRVLAFYSGFCTPFQQPWTEDIRVVSGFMDQAGLVSHQLRKFMPTEYLSKQDDNRSVSIPFALEHLAAAMLILASGYVLGFGALMMELLIKRKPSERSLKIVVSLMKK